MPDNWYDERDRREREWRRNERQGRGRDDDYEQADYGAAEDRSFGRSDYRGYGTSRFAARRSGPDRDHVFGERETTEVYTGEPRGRYGGADYRSSGGYGRPQDYARQNQDYVRDAQDGARGGRGYGDDGRERIYQDVYGQGGRYYGPGSARHEADRQRELDDDYWRFGFGFDPLEGGYAYPFLRGDRGERHDRERHDRGGYTPNVREGRGEGGRGWLDKARDEVSSWFGSRDAERRRDWDTKSDSHRGRGPQGYKRSDERISDEVHERLTDDPWVDASAIQVSVSAGEVTLSGTVNEREAKHRAERIVEDISGVHHVQNNLRIDRGAFFTRPTSGYGDSVQQAQMAGSPTAAASGTGLAASSATDATGSTDQSGSRGKSAN